MTIMMARDFYPAQIRTWLFGPGMPGAAWQAMGSSEADALIVDLEGSTPPALRAQARAGLAELLPNHWFSQNTQNQSILEGLIAPHQAHAP